jgi:SAM-dependent methyltransferase
LLDRLKRRLEGRRHDRGEKNGRELSRSEIHEYWLDPTDNNKPERYVDPRGGQTRSLKLMELVREYAQPEDAILEVGCNVGRNVHHLYSNGYRNLTGIEISDDAVAELRRQFPDTAAQARIINAPAEEALPQLDDGEFPLVFTMAVLVHIHPDSEQVVFPEIARVTGRTLILLEDEGTTDSSRHFQRNYGDVFTSLGLREVHSEPCSREEHGLPSVYRLRIFERA